MFMMKITMKYTALCFCFICILAYSYQLYKFSSVSSLFQYLRNYKIEDGILEHDEGYRFQAFDRSSHVNLSSVLETEWIRRKLSSDTQELWNFLSAQFGLYNGLTFKKFPTTEHLLANVRDYQRLLFNDLVAYKMAFSRERHLGKNKLFIFDKVSNTMSDLFTYTIDLLTTMKEDNITDLIKLQNKAKMTLKSKFLLVYRYLQEYMRSDDNERERKRRIAMDLRAKVIQNIETLQGLKMDDSMKVLFKPFESASLLIRVQNPENCSGTKKMVCGDFSQNRNCGFGCAVFHVSRCLMLAYFANRTMVLNSSSWNYSPRGWESAFLPMQTCSVNSVENNEQNVVDPRNLRALFNTSAETVAVRFSIPPLPEISPPIVPKDIKDRILEFNDHPPTWWFGQFKSWAIRLNGEVNDEVQNYIKKMKLSKPLLGLHIRRTDKGRPHPLEEYMYHAAKWFDLYETIHPVLPRNIYLATDEPSLIQEAVSEYPEYNFIHDLNISKSAGRSSRYTEASLKGLLKDFFSLLQCDFIICTFSSTYSRLVYEVMQGQSVDASHKFLSLDINYKPPRQPHDLGVAIESHQKTRPIELQFKKGDIVVVHQNEKDGYSIGAIRNNRGLFPTYKVAYEYKTTNISTRTN